MVTVDFKKYDHKSKFSREERMKLLRRAKKLFHAFDLSRAQIMIAGAAFVCLYLTLEFFLLPDVTLFKSGPVKSSAVLEQRREEARKNKKPFNPQLHYRPLFQISLNLQRAVIVSEDFDFFGHGGFAYSEVLKALRDSIARIKWPRGASTITQQVAKNLFLSTWRTPRRKLREAAITVLLERHLGKQRILELYLNIAEWGPGIFGADAAANHYFNTSASNLNAAQAAFLAAILPSPLSGFAPSSASQLINRRQRTILRRMNAARLPRAPASAGPLQVQK